MSVVRCWRTSFSRAVHYRRHRSLVHTRRSCFVFHSTVTFREFVSSPTCCALGKRKPTTATQCMQFGDATVQRKLTNLRAEVCIPLITTSPQLQPARHCLSCVCYAVTSKQASIFIYPINKQRHITSMNNIQGQAARKAHKAQHCWPPCKKNSKSKKTKQKHIHTCAQCRNTNRLVINRELY